MTENLTIENYNGIPIPKRHWWPILTHGCIPPLFILAILMTIVYKSGEQGTAMYYIMEYAFYYFGILGVIGGVWMIIDFGIDLKNGDA